MWRWIVNLFKSRKARAAEAEARKKKAMDGAEELSATLTQGVVLSEKVKALLDRETEKAGNGK